MSDHFGTLCIKGLNPLIIIDTLSSQEFDEALNLTSLEKKITHGVLSLEVHVIRIYVMFIIIIVME